MSRRRGLALGLVAVVLGMLGAGWVAVHEAMPGWYARLWYPLRHEEAIRAEAARYALDPALVAAVIDAESGFVPDARSPEGAVGLMQLLPSTARFVAGLEVRPSPGPRNLESPEVNIAYGSRYLRYLLDRHGAQDAALAAYNGGEANLERWRERAAVRGEPFSVPEHVTFPETRAFVRRVEEGHAIYRRAYDDRLSGDSQPRPDLGLNTIATREGSPFSGCEQGFSWCGQMANRAPANWPQRPRPCGSAPQTLARRGPVAQPRPVSISSMR